LISYGNQNLRETVGERRELSDEVKKKGEILLPITGSMKGIIHIALQGADEFSRRGIKKGSGPVLLSFWSEVRSG